MSFRRLLKHCTWRAPLWRSRDLLRSTPSVYTSVAEAARIASFHPDAAPETRFVMLVRREPTRRIISRYNAQRIPANAAHPRQSKYTIDVVDSVSDHFGGPPQRHDPPLQLQFCGRQQG
jgi:hypothetical protein